MSDLSALEAELKQLIVDSLGLEDVKLEDIDSEKTLFWTGLGLDSIDALELTLAVSKKFKIKIEKDTPREHFRSVRKLAEFVASQRPA